MYEQQASGLLIKMTLAAEYIIINGASNPTTYQIGNSLVLESHFQVRFSSCSLINISKIKSPPPKSVFHQQKSFSSSADQREDSYIIFFQATVFPLFWVLASFLYYSCRAFQTEQNTPAPFTPLVSLAWKQNNTPNVFEKHCLVFSKQHKVTTSYKGDSRCPKLPDRWHQRGR